MTRPCPTRPSSARRCHRAWRAALVAAAWLAVLSARPAPAEELLDAALESITAEELYGHVEVLADDQYEGRAAGSRGGHAAGEYIVGQLRPDDLTPAGDHGDYYQTFSDDCRNILVLQPGTDPKLKDQLIVVGAHYDHVGYGKRGNSYGPIGQIHNGADDNASGVSVLLETIQAFAVSGLHTRRSILFVFWDAEERGMVGSAYWLEHPTLPVERVRLAIHLDMVGRLRNGRLQVLGTRSGYGLRRLASGPVDDPMWLDFSWELSPNSDHWSFLERRIPVALLHTGVHADYHRPTDDVEKINREGMHEVGRYLLAMLVHAADADELPAYRRGAELGTVARQRAAERPLPTLALAAWPAGLPPPQLGISWRGDDAEPGAAYLTRVVAGTPAADAGLAVLDRIYAVDGQPFADVQAFDAAIHGLLDADVPQIDLLVETRGHVRTVTVHMPSSPDAATKRVE